MVLLLSGNSCGSIKFGSFVPDEPTQTAEISWSTDNSTLEDVDRLPQGTATR